MSTPGSTKALAADAGFLLIRLMVGFVGFFHGSQKIFGWFGGFGMEKFKEFLTSLNVPSPGVAAWLAALAEFVGGICLAFGIFPRIMALPFAFAMLVAVVKVHSASFSGDHGMEFPLTLAVVLIGLALTGPGRVTVMNALKRSPKPTPST